MAIPVGFEVSRELIEDFFGLFLHMGKLFSAHFYQLGTGFPNPDGVLIIKGPEEFIAGTPTCLATLSRVGPGSQSIKGLSAPRLARLRG